MTVREVLQEASQIISAMDAEVLLARSVGQDRAWLRAHNSDRVSDGVRRVFGQAVQRRAASEPLQYILGEQEFFGLPIGVAPGVLIPRPETEHLVEEVLSWSKSSSRVLEIVDVGTGSGAIALALAKHLPASRVTATDISSAALSIARKNAERLALLGRIRFVENDLLEHIGTEQIDVVVSNPPYVPQRDAATLQAEVLNYEPHSALFGGEDGLSIYRRLIPQAREVLRPGGLLAMEIGWGQRESLENFLGDWDHVRFRDDYAGIVRVVLAERK